MKYRIEFVPRFGTIIGIVWKELDINDEMYGETHREDSVGHIRIANEKEQELWTKVMTELNLTLEKESKNGIQSHQAQKNEQDIF